MRDQNPTAPACNRTILELKYEKEQLSVVFNPFLEILRNGFFIPCCSSFISHSFLSFHPYFIFHSTFFHQTLSGASHADRFCWKLRKPDSVVRPVGVVEFTVRSTSKLQCQELRTLTGL
ncbi:MAG TPA: hypothetical protein PKV50_07225 [Prolixibacteraceae bacterium]|nr:hypothetical protein [Prolixibacteraceae bacterium]